MVCASIGFKASYAGLVIRNANSLTIVQRAKYLLLPLMYLTHVQARTSSRKHPRDPDSRSRIESRTTQEETPSQLSIKLTLVTVACRCRFLLHFFKSPGPQKRPTMAVQLFSQRLLPLSLPALVPRCYGPPR